MKFHFHNEKENAVLKRNLDHFIIFGSLNFILLLATICFPAVAAHEGGHESDNISKTFFLSQIFMKYGGNEKEMTVKELGHLLKSIGLNKLVGKYLNDEEEDSHSHSHSKDEKRNSTVAELKQGKQNPELDVIHEGLLASVLHKNQCLTMRDLMTTFDIDEKSGTISNQQFSNLCPAIIYELDVHLCQHEEPHSLHVENTAAEHMVWLYAAAAVLIISLSGLLVVAVIPIMRGAFYHILIQFLVALAVGSLVGDAFLHLLPHSFSGDAHHSCESNHNHDDFRCVEDTHHLDEMVWKGVVGVTGIIIFFMAERLLTVYSLKRKQQPIPPSANKLLKDDDELKKSVGEKLYKNKYNSCNYRYGDITIDMLKGLNDSTCDPCCDEDDHHNCLEKASQTEEDATDNLKMQIYEKKNNCKHGGGDHFEDSETPNNNGVLLTQHEHSHHGHSHMHTHTQSVPTSITSVAWMVIMGDGLHNFSDGLAIGAAFSSSITGGISTSIAVFCHELPHELGDFAVLLKSGMTAKQALAYNGLSSILCFLGMLFGVALGNIAAITTWIFAGAAGMFVYIALVDMIPELNSAVKSTSSDCLHILVQFMGLLLGVSIMLIIALYEHDLQKVFHYE